MTRYSFWMLLVVVAGSIVGCGQEKELPTEVPKLESSVGAQQVVPTKSDADAKAVIDRAVTAFTGGKPELLAKGKLSRIVLNGTVLLPRGNEMRHVETTRNIVAAWPDRFFGMDENFLNGQKMSVKAWLRRPELTVMMGDVEDRPTDPIAKERNFACDTTAQTWMSLMLPMVDPTAIAFDFQLVRVDNRELELVKLSLDKQPLFQLTFDAKSHALLRTEYTLIEQGLPRRTTAIFSDHKSTPEGLAVPWKLEMRNDNTTVEKWTVDKWEFPATIDDKEFTPPKK